MSSASDDSLNLFAMLSCGKTLASPMRPLHFLNAGGPKYRTSHCSLYLQHCSRCAVSCTHFTTALCPLSRCLAVTRRSEGWSSVATHAARGPGLKRSIVFSNSPSPHSTALCCTVLAVSRSTAAAHQIPCSAAVMVMTLCLLLSPAAVSRTAD